MNNRLGLTLIAPLLAIAQARPAAPALAQGASQPASKAATPQARPQTKGEKPPVPTRPAGGDDAAAREAEKALALRKAQAVALLRGAVEGAGEIKKVAARAGVVADALDLLWKHDEVYARANFLKAADHALGLFASEESGQRAEARIAVNTILKALARHDPLASERLMGRYLKLAEDAAAPGAGGSAPSLYERLSLAESSLDLDAAQSAALAARVLEAGVPGSFPEYLYELERRDPGRAAPLLRTSLARVAGAGAYTPTQVTLLSTYAFREPRVLIPVNPGRALEAPPAFGMYTSPLEPPPGALNPALAREFLSAAGLYLSARAAALEQPAQLEWPYVGFCYFLVKKLRGYADKLDLNRDHAWQALEAKYELLAERARLDASTLASLSGLARRVVDDNNVFQFDGGASSFEWAEKTRDPAIKTELLVSGIRQLIDAQRFAEAEQRLDDIREERVREGLADYLHFRAADAALRRSDWDAAAARAARLGDERARAYLLLEAARLSLKAGRKDAALDHLRALMSILMKIEDVDAKARLLVAAAGMIYEADPAWGAEVLAEAVKAINRADGYDGRAYGVSFDLPNLAYWFPLADSDLARCFERAARADWAEAVGAARRINSIELQAAAQVAAARAVL